MKRKSKAQVIRRLAYLYPHWSYGQIAAKAGCDLSHVSRTLKRAGRPQSIFAIGKVARDHGFTIPMLKALGSRMQGAAR